MTPRQEFDSGRHAGRPAAGANPLPGTGRTACAWIIALALATLSGTAARAAAPVTIYKWTDSSGGVHYDDQNRSGVPVLSDDYTRNQKVKDTPDWVGVVPADFARDVERRCAQARERLDEARSAKVLYRRDASGNSVPMSEADVQALTADSRQEAEKLCAPDAPRRLYMEKMDRATPAAN